MSTLAAFLALGGGAYAAVSSIPGADGVIHGCYQKGRGNLRLVPTHKKCARGEKAIAFNQNGPQGLPGAQGVRGVQGFRGIVGSAGASGAPGAPGAKGEPGPQGPGATTFTTTLPQPSPQTVLLKLENGINIEGSCGSSSVAVFAFSSTGEDNVQASGTKFSGGTLMPVDINNNATDVRTGTGTEADIDVVARASTGKFARIDVHGSSGSSCTFWGMVIPSG